MTQIALFHSVLGVREGVRDAAERLRAAGHDVLVVDQYDGRVFDDYEAAGAFVETVGFPALMDRAVEAVRDLDDGFVAMGFSNGAGMAEWVATQRGVGGVVLVSGTLPLAMLGVDAWPAGVRAQVHATLGDPMRNQDWHDAVTSAIRAAGAPLEVFDYEGRGHLFTDASLPDEFDADATAALFERVLAFAPLAMSGRASAGLD
jgi:dienelactone hydrolase